MSGFIDAAIDVFEKQIQALYTNDFEKFISFMSPRIAKELTIESFQKAIELYKHRSIDIDAINRDLSKFYKEGESEEIPDKHVKLVLVGSGRTLCHVVQLEGMWLIDDIYWRIHSTKVEQEKDEEDRLKEEESIPPDKHLDFDDVKNTERYQEQDGEEDSEDVEEDDIIDD